MNPAFLTPPPVLAVPASAFTAQEVVDAGSIGGAAAHVTNVHMVQWIDRLAELHGASHGCSRRALAARGVLWFVSRHEIDYLAESRLGDVIGCATWTEELGRTVLVRASAFWNVHTQAAVCRARTRWGFIDLATRRPTRIDAAQRDALLAASTRP